MSRSASRSASRMRWPARATLGTGLLLIGALIEAPTRSAWADAGVLIPANLQQEPDPDILSLRSMDVRVRIDHLHARVDLKAVFQNHTDQQLEGRYVLPLGERATVEDFSVWQGEERLIGTIVEKQKGKRLFQEIVQRQLDPGLAETDDQPERAHDFVIRVAPIPPRGTARVEVTFSEDLAVTSGSAEFVLPLKPRRYGEQRAGELHIDVAAEGPYPLAEVAVRPQGRLRWQSAPTPGSTRFAGRFDGSDVPLTEDLSIEMRLGGGPTLDALAYRDVLPGGRVDISPFGDGTVYRDERGYFLVRTLVGPLADAQNLKQAASQAAGPRAPRDVVVLLDTSLSMQWEKLERSFAAFEYLLGRLTDVDRFSIVTFDEEVHPMPGGLMPVSSAARAAALKFVRESYLGGGTNLGAALASGLALLGGASPSPGRGPDTERFLVLVSDGNPTLGEIGYQKLGEEFARANGNAPGAAKAPARRLIARLFVLGVGDDAAGTLLGRLAGAGDGYFAQVREGGDASFLLRTFFDKLAQSPWREVALTIADLAGISYIYPPPQSTQSVVYAGSDATFFGRYAQPGKATATVRGQSSDKTLNETAAVNLPERDARRPWVGRGWARLRIADLLEHIDVEGEKDEWVREIIALAKEFHLVTPYTSFIAAPRALLRPRIIQPGDPVLRVKTAPGIDIRQVTAVFPFGLTQKLRYLPAEGVWETRFLAPTWMKDGRYRCLLVLTEADGRKTSEWKSFVIDSRPPRLRAEFAGGTRLAHAGEHLELTVRADADTRRIQARIGDGPAAEVLWDPVRRLSVGTLSVPRDQPTGRATVVVTAEDMAHNVASIELPLDVAGGR